MWQRYIDGQYRQPTGPVGRWIGNKMAQQHQPENLWTVNLLDVQPSDHILEVGFGPGIAIKEVARRASQGFVAGIDFSRTMVAAARKRTLREINRVLKTGGLLILTVLPKEKWNPANPDAAGTPECKPYSGDELKTMLGESGFSDLRIEADARSDVPSNFSVTGRK